MVSFFVAEIDVLLEIFFCGKTLKPTFIEAQLFQKSTFFYETLAKFRKRCGATDSNNMRIANWTLNLPKFSRKPSTMNSYF